MWENFEARLGENERECTNLLSRVLFDVLRSSGLRSDHDTRKWSHFNLARVSGCCRIARWPSGLVSRSDLQVRFLMV